MSIDIETTDKIRSLLNHFQNKLKKLNINVDVDNFMGSINELSKSYHITVYDGSIEFSEHASKSSIHDELLLSLDIYSIINCIYDTHSRKCSDGTIQIFGKDILQYTGHYVYGVVNYSYGDVHTSECCYGGAAPLIYQAIVDGRLEDLFDLVNSVGVLEVDRKDGEEHPVMPTKRKNTPSVEDLMEEINMPEPASVTADIEGLPGVEEAIKTKAPPEELFQDEKELPIIPSMPKFKTEDGGEALLDLMDRLRG